MAEVNFNMSTLDHYLKSNDEDFKDLAETCKTDFKDYSDIVLTFDAKMNNWRQTKSGDEYRSNVSKLDKKRKMIHDNCLNDITIINRLAKADGIEPFTTSDEKDLSRTDFGNAIIALNFENVVKQTGVEGKQAVKKINNFADKRKIVNDYNFMLNGYTKYPLIKDDDKKYKFTNMFTGKAVSLATVKNYVKDRTDDPNKLTQFSKATELIDTKVKEGTPIMANSNILNNNSKAIKSVLKDFKPENRDEALKTYGDAIKQVPDHFQNKGKKVRPTTIAGAARNLIHAINTKDDSLLDIEPQEYLDILKKNHKDGNWTLFDYKNKMPLDSSPDKVKDLLTTYDKGIDKQIEAEREQGEPEL